MLRSAQSSDVDRPGETKATETRRGAQSKRLLGRSPPKRASGTRGNTHPRMLDLCWTSNRQHTIFALLHDFRMLEQTLFMRRGSQIQYFEGASTACLSFIWVGEIRDRS